MSWVAVTVYGSMDSPLTSKDLQETIALSAAAGGMAERRGAPDVGGCVPTFQRGRVCPRGGPRPLGAVEEQGGSGGDSF
jgi:hypothetical protein